MRNVKTTDEQSFNEFSFGESEGDVEVVDDEDSPSILETISQEEILDGQSLLKKIAPAKWDSFISIIDFLTKESDDPLTIKDSVIKHKFKEAATIRVDLLQIFDNQKIDLHISTPKKWVRLFKNFKNTDIYIVENKDINQFIVTNGEVKLFLPVQLDSVVEGMNFPSFNDSKVLTKCSINKETRDKINNFSKGFTYIELLIHEEKLKCVNIPNTASIIMPEFIKDKTARNLDSNAADYTLRTSVFLPFNSEQYDIIVGQRPDKTFFLYSSCIANLVKIETYENLDDASGIDLLV